MSTCRDCRFWHQQPIDPANIGAERPGECREQLRAQPIVQMTQLGPKLLGWVSGYPTIAAEFEACGRFELRQIEG